VGDQVLDELDRPAEFRPITLGGTCSTLKELAEQAPPLNLALLPALTDPKACGTK